MTRLLIMTMCSLLAAAVCLASQATVQDADDAVESGRQSLTHRNSYPWYDAENDRLRRIEMTPDEADDSDAIRDSNWSTDPDPSQPATTAPLRASSGALSGVMQAGFWFLLAAVLSLVIGLIVWAFLRRGMRLENSEIGGVASREVDRLEELPFAVKRPQSDLLGEARRHYEQGNYGEAIMYLFSYQLVELDKHQIIRLAKGKTNRQYLGESRRLPVVLPLLEETMIAFEDVFFGHHPLERDRFESCWSRVEDFQRNLRGGVT